MRTQKCSCSKLFISVHCSCERRARLVLDLQFSSLLYLQLSGICEDNNHKGSYGSVAPLVNEHWSSSSDSSDSSILTPEQLFRHMHRVLAHWSSHSSAHFYTPLPPPCRPHQGKESCATGMSWINWEKYLLCCVTIIWSDSLRSVFAKRLNGLAYTFFVVCKDYFDKQSVLIIQLFDTWKCFTLQTIK